MKSLENEIQVKEFRNESIKAIINIFYTNNAISNHSHDLMKPYNVT